MNPNLNTNNFSLDPSFLPHVHTLTRPLPPLPAHLQQQLNSQPNSPDPLPASSSTDSTPNAQPSPSLSDPQTDFRKRWRQGDRGEGSSSSVRTISPARGGRKAAAAKEDEVDSPEMMEAKRQAKRVKVGARASIACATCRKRKVRCSAEWPTCKFCLGKNFSCVYEGHPAEHGGTLSSPFGLANLVSMSSIEPILPPLEIILEALDPFFLHNYDTFYFLHRPTLTEQIRAGTAPKELVCCILAFAARFSQSLRDLHPGPPTAASEHYAALAAQVLLNPPSITSGTSTPSATPVGLDGDVSLVRCQSFLMLGLYECTEGTENKGWLKVGVAVRMAQVLRLGFQDEDEGSSSRGRSNPINEEIRRRTFWSCFLLDRTITDGKERPCTLKVPLPYALRMPGNDADFVAGRRSQGARFNASLPPWNMPARLEANPVHEPEADLYGQNLRISEVWQRVATYIGSGGRNFDRRAPWLPDSTFSQLDREIKDFSERLPAVFRYTDANLVAHSMINQGRLFGMLHLILSCCNLVLHRDYLPFLPPPGFNAADGPVDGEPLYGNPQAPPQWWSDCVMTAIVAANTISDLCVGLAQHGSQQTHPFAGFAALGAGTVHAHLKYCPLSSRIPIDSSYYLDQDMSVLTALREVYPIATSWTEGLQKLQALYSNVSRGVIDSDPSKVRASVIKLLRTAKEEETSASPARSASSNGMLNNQLDTASQFAHAPPLDFSTTDLNIDDDYSLDLFNGFDTSADFFGTNWTDFSFLASNPMDRTSFWSAI